jgi:hypothetical protein
MTVQRTNAITLEEIIGIQFECKKCKARIIIPVSAKGRVPIKCTCCGDSWVIDNSTEFHQRFFTAVGEFVEAMNQIADGRYNVNCIFSVEVKPEIKMPDASRVPDV